MKKQYLLTWLTIVWALLFLSWCDSNSIKWQWTTVIDYPAEDKEIISILEKFANKQDLKNTIKQEVLTRSDSNYDKDYDVN